MQQEIRQCQNCKQDFVVEPEDFDFYEKIKVPPPTFCPECRFQRRLAFFNLTTLYKRPCDLCKKEVVSSYTPDAPYVVYCPKCWWSDKWDALDYGQDFDFSKPFLEQWNNLHHKVPLPGLAVDYLALVNSEFTNHAGHLKNCYLIFQADFDEDCAYGFILKSSKSLLDCSLALQAEFCYDSTNLFKSNRCIGGQGNVTESFDCAFLRDCDNCQNCFASANLRNKKYHIFNQPYTKEDYFNKIKQWDLGSYNGYRAAKELAEKHWSALPPRPQHDDFSSNCSGSYVFQSKSCKQCFDVVGAEDGKFLFMLSLPPIKDCYDVSAWGNNINLMYESIAVGENSSQIHFCAESGINALDAEYSRQLMGGSHNFGCVGIKKGEYCILNKKYSEQEFMELRNKIISHMAEMPYTDKGGRVYKYGEFFPAEFSPFPYNDTVAQWFFPGEQKEGEKRAYAITKKASELEDHIKDAPQSITSEVIGCATCGGGFKIIQFEFEFLKRMNLPLPRQCPFCRIKGKIGQLVKNLRVFERVCSKCGAEFQTNYPKEEVEYILCKQCYQQEVA